MAGTRGFGIFAHKSDNEQWSFLLQHRAMELGAELPYSKDALSLVSEAYLQHCPWCGATLAKFYEHPDEIARPDLKIG